MKQLSKQEKHDQCIREIKGTLFVVALCCIWHIATAFILNGTGLYFLGMPAWFSVSVFGTILIALIGVRFLLKKVFVDFEYDEEPHGVGKAGKTELALAECPDDATDEEAL